MLQTPERPFELLASPDDMSRRNKAAWLSHGNLMAYGEFESVLSTYRNPNTSAQQPATA
jgi:hypothetical protein